MTEKVFIALVSSMIAFVLNVLWQNSQFHRSYKFTYKNKIRNLKQLIRDSKAQFELQIKSLDEVIAALQSDTIVTPKLRISFYSAIDLLAEKVKDDEYHAAYNRIFKNAIGAKDKFDDLRLATLLLDRKFIELKEYMENAVSQNHERMIRLNSTYNDIKKAANEIMVSQEQALSNERFELIGIFTAFGNMRQSDSDMSELYNLLIQPMANYIKNLPQVAPALIPLGNLIDDFFYLYHDILFQNRQILPQLNDSKKQFEENQKRLVELYRYFSNQQLKNLFE